MDGTLKLIRSTLAFGDPNTSQNPLKRFVDWTTDQTVSVENPKSEPFTVDPGATVTLFSGSRSIAADNSTQWTLTLSTLDASRYRLTNTAGTAPVLRTARTLNLATLAVTVTPNANQTATIAATGAFGALQVGDALFIAGTTTGDPSLAQFNALNEGIWTVLSVTANAIQVARPTGATFQAYGETITVALAATVLAFSAAGVQVGDGVNISAGFSQPVLKSYEVVAVTPGWFEVISTSPLPVSAVGTPGTNGIQFYNSAKRHVEVYADQECVVRVNGDTGNTNSVSPWQAGDANQMGHYSKDGLCWSMVVVNLSTLPLNLQFISAE